MWNEKSFSYLSASLPGGVLGLSYINIVYQDKIKKVPPSPEWFVHKTGQQV